MEKWSVSDPRVAFIVTLDSGYASLAGTPQRWYCVLLTPYPQLSICATTGDHFNHFLTVVSANFSSVILLFLSL